MKQTKYNKIMIIFILFILCSMGAFVLPVSAVGLTESTGFEDGTIDNYDAEGTSYSNYFLQAQIMPAGISQDFYVNNDNVLSGSKSFYINGGYAGGSWWNYTYSQTKKIIQWESYGFMDTTGGSATVDIYFYNSSQSIAGFDADAFIHLKISEDGGKLEYFDHAGDNYQVGSGIFENEFWHKFGFIITDTDSVSYYVNDTYRYDTPRNTSITRIDSVRYEWIGTPEFSMDSHTITYDDTYGSSGAVACGETPDINSIGIIRGADYKPINEQYIEWTYDVPMSTTFYYLDIDAGATQYTQDSDLSHYFGHINGQGIGNPDCFFRYLDTYVLRWEFYDNPITIVNKKPLIELYHNTPLQTQVYTAYDICCYTNPFTGAKERCHKCNFRTETTDIYWMIGTGTADSDDMDGDLDTIHRIGGSSNGVLDGKEQFADISYKLYFDDVIEPEPEVYDLDLALSGYSTVLSDGTPAYYNKTDTVFISYFLDDLSISNYLRIWHIDTGVEVGLTQGFGLGNILTKSSRTKGFMPYNTGNYRVSIYQSGANVTNKSFYVYPCVDEDKILYTMKNPSESFNSYGVYYGYTHPDGWTGAIGMSHSSSFNIKDECEYFIENIKSGTTGVFNYAPNSYNTQYWRLFTSVNNGTTYLPYGGIHTHYIYDVTTTDDYISVEFPTLWLDASFENQRSNYFSGSHTHLGADIWIRVNDVPVISVSDTQVFRKGYKPKDLGLHVVKLSLNNNGTWNDLDIAYFNVTSHTDDIADTEGILPDLGVTMGAIVGLIVTMFCTLSPLVVTKGLKTKHSVPSIVYAFTCCLGISVSVLLGFFPFWIIPFIVIIGIIILMIQYIINGGGSKGE